MISLHVHILTDAERLGWKTWAKSVDDVAVCVIRMTTERDWSTASSAGDGATSVARLWHLCGGRQRDGRYRHYMYSLAASTPLSGRYPSISSPSTDCQLCSSIAVRALLQWRRWHWLQFTCFSYNIQNSRIASAHPDFIVAVRNLRNFGGVVRYVDLQPVSHASGRVSCWSGYSEVNFAWLSHYSATLCGPKPYSSLGMLCGINITWSSYCFSFEILVWLWLLSWTSAYLTVGIATDVTAWRVNVAFALCIFLCCY